MRRRQPRKVCGGKGARRLLVRGRGSRVEAVQSGVDGTCETATGSLAEESAAVLGVWVALPAGRCELPAGVGVELRMKFSAPGSCVIDVALHSTCRASSVIFTVVAVRQMWAGSGLGALAGRSCGHVRAGIGSRLGGRLWQRASSSDRAVMAAAMTNARVRRGLVSLGALRGRG
eukprot:scaffold262748_cov16-Prasinocladus_malaysianus.AAC.1